MRRPIADELAWWRDALAAKRPVVTEQPHAGWWKRKLIKDGPWVGVRTWHHQDIDQETGELMCDVYLCCDVDGKPASPDDQWLWCCMNPITEAEYLYLTRLSKYAKKHAPREPLARPREKIDLLSAPPPKFIKKRKPT